VFLLADDESFIVRAVIPVGGRSMACIPSH
jgi:hypothetical protein